MMYFEASNLPIYTHYASDSVLKPLIPIHIGLVIFEYRFILLHILFFILFYVSNFYGTLEKGTPIFKLIVY